MSLTDDVAFLSGASLISLEDFELSRLAHVRSLLKRREVLDSEIRKEQAIADVARLLIENWRLREVMGSPPVQISLLFDEPKKEPKKGGKSEAA